MCIYIYIHTAIAAAQSASNFAKAALMSSPQAAAAGACYMPISI